MSDKLAEHSIWEDVFLTRPGGRMWKDGHYDVVCKTCKSEQPKHTEDCEVAALEQRVERLAGGHEQIVEWSKAYPLDVFPEPDFKKAAELLKAGGMTLDAISASNMRHVVEGVGGIAKEALHE